MRTPAEAIDFTTPVCGTPLYAGTVTGTTAEAMRLLAVTGSSIGEATLTHWLTVAVFVTVFFLVLAAAGEAPAISPSDASPAQPSSAIRAERFLIIPSPVDRVRARPRAPLSGRDPTRSSGGFPALFLPLPLRLVAVGDVERESVDLADVWAGDVLDDQRPVAARESPDERAQCLLRSERPGDRRARARVPWHRDWPREPVSELDEGARATRRTRPVTVAAVVRAVVAIGGQRDRAASRRNQEERQIP